MTVGPGTQSATVTLNVTSPNTSGLTLSSSTLYVQRRCRWSRSSLADPHRDSPDQYQRNRPGVGAELQHQHLADYLTDR